MFVITCYSSPGKCYGHALLLCFSWLEHTLGLCLYHCESPAAAHSRSSINASGLNTKEKIGLESWASPSKARTRATNLHIFFPLSNMWNKIQMNQLFQGQSFNYIPASFSADKNINSLLTPGPTAGLLSSAAQRGTHPLGLGDSSSSLPVIHCARSQEPKPRAPV